MGVLTQSEPTPHTMNLVYLTPLIGLAVAGPFQGNEQATGVLHSKAKAGFGFWGSKSTKEAAKEIGEDMKELTEEWENNICKLDSVKKMRELAEDFEDSHLPEGEISKFSSCTLSCKLADFGKDFIGTAHEEVAEEAEGFFPACAGCLKHLPSTARAGGLTFPAKSKCKSSSWNPFG